MFAIVDANVVAEVFGTNRPEAGKKFFDWITTGKGRLVVGGNLLRELDRSSEGFRTWGQQAKLSGKLLAENEQEVNTRTNELQAEGTCRSNDPHVIALAQVSRVRLLYSNDKNLQLDFKNRNLIDRPRGRVYSTVKRNDFSPTHRKLLGTRNLCGVGHYLSSRGRGRHGQRAAGDREIR